MKSTSGFFNKGDNVAHFLLCLFAQFWAINAFVFPANECSAQGFKFFPFGGSEIRFHQSSLKDKSRNHIFERAFQILQSPASFVHKFPSDFMLPAFHESYKLALAPANGFFTFALADKPIRQKSDDNAASGGNESTKQSGDDFVSELAQWFLLAFAVLIGAGIALLLELQMR